MHKQMKKTTLYLLMLSCTIMLLSVSCGDDNKSKTKKPNPQAEISYPEYSGRVTVDNGYLQDDVISRFKSLGNNTYDITMYKVRFSDNMPVYVDVDLKDLPATIQGEDTIIKIDTLIPYAMNGYLGHYTFYNFNCKVNKDSMIFTTDSAGFNIEYRAKRTQEL